MKTVVELILAWLIGWFAATILLGAFENAHPGDSQLESSKRQINEARKKLAFRSGLIVAFIWLMYHLTPAFGD